ncbi:hypothetical protein MMC14_006113 [Varicellaria rhodocarpa]|nr:hypothetical protein [Varicellaria rhodocarpa]
MSAEETRLFAPTLRQHLETTDQEMSKTKQELGRYKALATLGDVAGHVYTLLFKNGPNTAVKFAEVLAKEADEGQSGEGADALDHPLLQMNDIHLSHIKLLRDLAKFAIDFYADRIRKFHGPIKALSAKKEWCQLAHCLVPRATGEASRDRLGIAERQCEETPIVHLLG